MDIIVNNHEHFAETPKTDEILKLLKANQETLLLIIKNQQNMANELDDLKQEVADLKTAQADLQTSVDLEQEQIKTLLDNNVAVVQALNEKIAALEAAAADAIDPAAIREVITGLQEIKEGIATTKGDIEGTV